MSSNLQKVIKDTAYDEDMGVAREVWHSIYNNPANLQLGFVQGCWTCLVKLRVAWEREEQITVVAYILKQLNISNSHGVRG